MHFNEYTPMGGGSWKDLPPKIKEKNNGRMCILNVENKDDECFRWAVLSAMEDTKAPKDGKNKTRVSWYTPHKDKLNFEGLDFPIAVDYIHKFERKNPQLAISAYELLADVKNENDVPAIHLLS